MGAFEYPKTNSRNGNKEELYFLLYCTLRSATILCASFVAETGFRINANIYVIRSNFMTISAELFKFGLNIFYSLKKRIWPRLNP